LAGDWCPECTRVRLQHDSIRMQFYDKCNRVRGVRGNLMCHPTDPPLCPSCVEYFAGATHHFFTTNPG
jgi:hypothetical protein